jgi:hypothetical protein
MSTIDSEYIQIGEGVERLIQNKSANPIKVQFKIITSTNLPQHVSMYLTSG